MVSRRLPTCKPRLVAGHAGADRGGDVVGRFTSGRCAVVATGAIGGNSKRAVVDFGHIPSAGRGMAGFTTVSRRQVIG